MARRIAGLLAAVTGLVAIVVVIEIAAQGGSAKRPRIVRHMTGRPLSSLVKADDTDVVVVSNSTPFLRVEAPRGTSEIAWETEAADVILKVRIDNKRSALTEAADWVRTTVVAVVQEVLKPSSKLNFEPGQNMTFTVDGGEIALVVPNHLNPVRIQADVPWASRFQTGEEYLLFGGIPQDQLLISPQDCYELTTDGYVRSLWRDRGPDEINGALTTVVLAAIRRLAPGIAHSAVDFRRGSRRRPQDRAACDRRGLCTAAAYGVMCHVRLDRSGAWGLEANGSAMLRIRCALYNGTFNQIFADYMVAQAREKASR